MKLFCLLSIGFLTGCLTEGNSTPSSSSTSSTVLSPGFSGATSATNLDGATVQISWVAATNTAVTGYDIYQVAGGTTLTYLSSVSTPAISFVATGLTTSTLYTFVVRAVGTGITDSNLVRVSAFTYPGITTAVVSSTTSATLTYPAALAASSLTIVYKAARSSSWTSLTVARTSTSQLVTGLQSGTTYTFKVQAVTSSTTDGNLVTQTIQTTSNSSTKYKGPLLVSAYGDAANAPAGTPSARQITITWLGFTGNSASTQYTLVRTAKSGTIDMATTTACTAGVTDSCKVCQLTGSGAQSCTDTNIAASPQQYDYAVTQSSSSGWPEEVPASDTPYRITVPVPPVNMILVHRDAANYETCANLSKTSDPLNHQRCSFSGGSMIGAAAYNTSPGESPLNSTAGYYDFGYNLFVDRWNAACNWTPQASGGMCGAGATPGSCFGSATPASTVGAVGNVFYNANDANCYYKKTAGAAWISANTSTLTSAERALIYTVDPSTTGNKKPPLVNIDQNRSWDTCQSAYDGDYGKYKRLLRQREYRAMAAWPSLTGEPGALTDGVIGGMEDGSTYGHSAGNYSCNSNNHWGLTAGAFTATEMAGDAGDAIKSMTIGSLATSKCVSRFGAQDHVGNVWQWVSDQMSCNNITHTCSGTASALDSGNGYSSGFDMNGFLFNGTQGPGGTGAGQVAASYTSEWSILTGLTAGTGGAQGFGAGYFNFTLGLPMVGNDNGNNILISANTAKYHNDRIYIYTENGPSRGLFVGGDWSVGSGSGRWASNWKYSPSDAGSTFGFRCALPAE